MDVEPIAPFMHLINGCDGSICKGCLFGMYQLFVVFALLVGVLVPTPAQNATAPAFKVGMVSDVGGLQDGSFNQSAYGGLQRTAKELGAGVKAIESRAHEEYEPNLQALASEGFDLIWGIGFMMQDAVDQTARQNPTRQFALIDAVAAAPNVTSITFKEEESAFLMGVMAAKATKTRKVGFVGGMDIGVVHRFDYGFQAGVKAVDPTIEVKRVYAGTFADPAKGKEIGLSLIDHGVDVLFHASGATGIGVIDAAASRKVYAIGVDVDQNSLAPEYVLSSAMKHIDVAVYSVSKAVQEGTLKGGQVLDLGLKEGAVGYAPTTLWHKLPPDTRGLVDQWTEAVASGTVKVPGSMHEFQAWNVPTP